MRLFKAMSRRYEIYLTDVRGKGAKTVGKFAVTFLVRPPVEFASDEARLELGSHLLDMINVIGDYSLRERTPESLTSYAHASFTHELPGKPRASVGTISGNTEDERGISKDTIAEALEIVLNGPEA
jgi:hypothetical protein